MENLIVKGFKKVNESVHPELIGMDELSVLTNMFLDCEGSLGIPKKRGGYNKFNSNAVGQNIISMHDVVDNYGVNHLLISQTTKLQKSASGTGSFSDVKTGLTTGLKTRIASLGNGKYVLTNGVDTPFIIGDILSSLGGFNEVWNLPIPKPDIQGMSLAVSPDGNLTASKCYAYVIVYVSNTGDISDVSDKIWEQTTDVNKTITLNNIPTTADTRVKSKRIYRTEGEGNVFYFRATLGIGEDTFKDKDADTSLDLSMTIDVINTPEKAKYLTVHKNRLFLANITQNLQHDIQKPDYSFSATPKTFDGSIADGTYKYKISYTNQAGYESELTPYKTVTISGGSGSGSVDVIGSSPFIGGNRYNKNTDIYRARVYRTKAGGSTYYEVYSILVSDMVLAGFPFTDTKNDSDLTYTYPQGSEYFTSETEQKEAIVYSNISNYSTIPANNIIYTNLDKADEITAIYDYNDSLVIFKKNSICRIYTNGSPSQWIVKKETDVFGCDEPNSIIKVGDVIYFSKNKKYYKYSNGSVDPTPVSEGFQVSFNQITTFNDVCYSSVKNWIILAVQVSSTHYLFTYDLKLNTWYKFTVSSAYSLLEKKVGSNSGVILIGNNSYILKYDDSAILDSEASTDTTIAITLRTKTFCFPDGISEARLRRIYVNYKSIKAGDTGGGVSHTIQNPDTNEFRGVIEGNTDSVPVVFAKVTDQMNGVLRNTSKLYYEVVGEGLSELYSFVIEYNPMRRRTYEAKNDIGYADSFANRNREY